MVQPNSYPSLTDFGSTMHGGIESLILSMPYLQKLFDYYYIQKKGFTAPLLLYNIRILKNSGQTEVEKNRTFR